MGFGELREAEEITPAGSDNVLHCGAIREGL